MINQTLERRIKWLRSFIETVEREYSSPISKMEFEYKYELEPIKTELAEFLKIQEILSNVDSVEIINTDQPFKTLRDEFAIAAMQAFISTAGAPCLNGLDNLEPYTAKAAYKMAEAMIEARKL